MKFSKVSLPFLRVSFWIWLFTILVLMSIPTSGVSLNSFPGEDKLLHFGVFGVLGFLFSALRIKSVKVFGISWKNGSTYLLLLFSIVIEFIQLLLTYRSFELLDIFMNGLGLISGILVGDYIIKRVFRD